MKLASWNIEGRLCDLAINKRGTPEAIVAGLRQLDADVVVHPEAFGNEPPMRPEIAAALRDLGYEHREVQYEDAADRPEGSAVTEPHLMILSRLPILNSEVIRPGNVRNMVSVTVQEPGSGREVRIIGVHLDDRNEKLRLTEVEPLIEYINSSTIPTIMMGDFNAMPPNTFKSRIIHSGLFRKGVRLLPHRHMRYVLRRLSEMATGTTIAALLSRTRLVNTDPSCRPTTTPKMRRMEWMPSIRFAKIDWILVSPDVVYKNFAISRDLGSDHRALSLEVSLKNG